MEPKSKTVILGDVEGKIDTPFVLKFAEPRNKRPNDGSTNYIADTCAIELGVQADALPSAEKFGSTDRMGGQPGESADTTFDGF